MAPGKEVKSMHSCLGTVNQSGSQLCTVVQFSGVQQLSMCTHNIQNCSAWPKAKIFGIARIDNPQVELKKSKVYHHCC